MDMPIQEHTMHMHMGGGEIDEEYHHSQILHNDQSFTFEEELLELYEAFHPNTFTTPPPPPLQHLIAPSSSVPLFHSHPPPPPHEAVAADMTNPEQLQELAVLQRQLQAQQQFQLQQMQHSQVHPQQNQRKTSGIRKKRKTEQMKTVYRVPAENILTVDKWAWRKYGQKPIKGSPFPRNYYRCSSSKGCVARKQVERSITEPEVYVVTYSGDHFHPWPVHRNALAGVSRADHRICSYSCRRDDDQSSAASHVAFPELSPPQLPLPAPPEEGAEEEEEGEVLLIPNRMYMDEDMLRGMEELGNWKTVKGSDSGSIL